MWLIIRQYTCMVKVLAAAILVAYVTFQVGTRPLGGISRRDGPLQGDVEYIAKVALIWPDTYSSFIILNTIAFAGSLSIIILLTSGDFVPFQIPKAFIRWVVMVWATISSVSLAYTAALSVLIFNVRNYEDFEDDSIFRVLWLILAIWSLPAFSLLLHLREYISRNMMEVAAI